MRNTGTLIIHLTDQIFLRQSAPDFILVSPFSIEIIARNKGKNSASAADSSSKMAALKNG